MNRPPTWPELDRLARVVRATDSVTDALALWTGHGVGVETTRHVDRVFPESEVAESLALTDGTRVQERDVHLHCGGLVVASMRCWLAVDSAALTPAVRLALGDGAEFEPLLRALPSRRVTVRLAKQLAAPAGDQEAPVLTAQARLDVSGTPVAWCEETIYEAVFAWDRGILGGAFTGGRPYRARVPA